MPEQENKPDDLRGWGKHILKELDRNHEDHGLIFNRLNAQDVQLATLKTKAALVGALAGGILSIAVAIIIWALTKK